MARYNGYRDRHQFREAVPGTVIERPVAYDPEIARLDPISRAVDAILVVVEAILFLRLIFRLIGAASTGFVAFIYNLSHPLVSPFYGIVNTNLGVASLEWATLIAMLVYAIVGYVIIAVARLLLAPPAV